MTIDANRTSQNKSRIENRNFIPCIVADGRRTQSRPLLIFGEGGEVVLDVGEAFGAVGFGVFEIGDLFGGFEGKHVELHFGFGAGGADGDVVAGGSEGRA